MVSVIKKVTRHQRTAATHILVFMISNEERRKKPYAMPVQCMPYTSLSDFKVRELANLIIGEMTSRKMKVAGICKCLSIFNFIGFTTDGEFNSLRAKGITRPLSIFQIHCDVRRKYA